MLFKNKNCVKYSILIILSYILAFSIITQNSSAFWGYTGDCRDQHGISYLKLPYDPNAEINLDGIPSESFWDDPANNEGKVLIPLASRVGPAGKPDIRTYMNATFVMNREYIYILCEWEDTTTEPDNYFVDGLFFCWDINVTNFSANFYNSMRTESMGGGRVDSWSFYYLPSYTPGSSITNDDECFADKGWLSGSEKRDGSFSFTYQDDYSYTVEFSRKLITNDNRDVQFNQNKTYLFNMAILDNSFGENHAISWTYGLNVTLPPPEKETDLIIDSFIMTYVILTCLISIALIKIFTIQKLSNKKHQG